MPPVAATGVPIVALALPLVAILVVRPAGRPMAGAVAPVTHICICAPVLLIPLPFALPTTPFVVVARAAGPPTVITTIPSTARARPPVFDALPPAAALPALGQA